MTSLSRLLPNWVKDSYKKHGCLLMATKLPLVEEYSPRMNDKPIAKNRDHLLAPPSD